MKKTLFSMFFVAIFGVYALFQRAESPNFVATNTTISTQSDNPIASAGSPFTEITTQPITDSSPTQTVTPTPAPTPTPIPTPQPVQAPPTNKLYKDGTYTGVSADAYYGYVQVQVTTQNDKIVDVQFLDYPHDRGTSIQINSFARPRLISEAIQVQSAQVDTISGATDTSIAFRQSLSSALDSAHV